MSTTARDKRKHAYTARKTSVSPAVYRLFDFVVNCHTKVSNRLLPKEQHGWEKRRELVLVHIKHNIGMAVVITKESRGMWNWPRQIDWTTNQSSWPSDRKIVANFVCSEMIKNDPNETEYLRTLNTITRFCHATMQLPTGVKRKQLQLWRCLQSIDCGVQSNLPINRYVLPWLHPATPQEKNAGPQ